MLNGVITALLTPFKNGVVDKQSFVKLVHQQLEQKVDGFVINGTTGESPTLNITEIRALYDIARTETQGLSLQILVGTGSNSTAATCDMSVLVSQWKPDALLVVVPYYNRPPQRGLREHFSAVAQASTVPIVLYNVPSRTVASLDPQTISELSRIDNIAGIKDATGDMQVLEQIRLGATQKFSLLSGDDASCVEFAQRGGAGVISVSSHIIGAEMKAFIGQAQAGDVTANTTYRNRYQDLMKWLYIEPNPIPVKAALHWMGVIESPELRLPLTKLDEKFHGEFKSCLKNLGKL